MRLGASKGKAHRREYLGYIGGRILVSRKWSGKTLADHRADRKAWLTETLELPATEQRRFAWEAVKPTTATTSPLFGGSCTSSPSESAGNKPSPKPEDEPMARQEAG